MTSHLRLARVVAIGAMAIALGTFTSAFADGARGHALSGGGGSHFAGGAGSHFAAGRGSHFTGSARGGTFAPRASFASRGGVRSFSPRSAYYARGGYGRVGNFRGSYYAPGRFARGGYYRGGGFYGARFSWFLPILPALYATYWFGGIPYYYANDAYYTWNPGYNGYVATDPPVGSADSYDDSAAAASDGAPPANADLYIYSKNGQTRAAAGD